MVGAGWGAVHVTALRACGVEVVALCGAPLDGARTRAVAAEYGVPLALGDLEAALRLHPDLVTVATPAVTHAEVLARLRDVPVLCEKPLLGLRGDPAVLAARTAPLEVNFAFAFLDAARALAALLPARGRIHEVRLSSDYDLPLRFTAAQWFLEAASHPLSFALHLLDGPVTVDDGAVGPSSARLRLTVGGVPVVADSRRVGGLDGMRHTLAVVTDDGEPAVTGCFRSGSPWRFSVVGADGSALPDLGDQADEGPGADPWVSANRRSIAAAVRRLRGGEAPGLLTIDQALAIDVAARRAFGASAPAGP